MSSQPLEKGLEINVQGSGWITRPAERGILVLKAQSQQVASPSEASAAITTTANILRDAIATHCPQDKTTGRTLDGAAISHYSMSTLDTSSHQQRADKDGTTFPTLYSARVEFHIKFADFNVLDTLATRFSAMENITIQKIDWCLTDATLGSIRGIARKKAAQDAIQKARDYAEVFAGVAADDLAEKVQASSITEGNYYTQSTRPQLHYGKQQRTAGMKKGSEELQFQPEDVRLQVQVTAKFVVK